MYEMFSDLILPSTFGIMVGKCANGCEWVVAGALRQAIMESVQVPNYTHLPVRTSEGDARRPM
jgi:hypothetical protein